MEAIDFASAPFYVDNLDAQNDAIAKSGLNCRDVFDARDGQKP